jgi:hypothetical protein
MRPMKLKRPSPSDKANGVSAANEADEANGASAADKALEANGARPMRLMRLMRPSLSD